MKDTTTLTIEERSDDLKVIHIHGDLDSMGTHMVQDAFNEALSNRRDRAVVALDDVNFISSAGMAMLLMRGKMLKQGGGQLAIAAPGDRVQEVLSLAGFHELFEVYDTLDEAIEALKA